MKEVGLSGGYLAVNSGSMTGKEYIGIWFVVEREGQNGMKTRSCQFGLYLYVVERTENPVVRIAIFFAHLVSCGLSDFARHSRRPTRELSAPDTPNASDPSERK